MIDFNKAIELIRRNGGFKPNKHESSYYRVYTTSGSKPMQVRVSSHGTHLWTWYDKDYDPSYSINTCVVYSEDGTHDSNVAVDMRKTNEQGAVIGEKKMFEVIQYVYNCQLLDDNDAALINQAILSTWQTKSFKDPFAGTPKHAKVFNLKPNEPIETLVENKETNENRKMNKKQTIRLNEAQFNELIKESVKKILNELDWRTYRSAAQKQIERGDNDERAERFYDASNKALEREMGLRDTPSERSRLSTTNRHSSPYGTYFGGDYWDDVITYTNDGDVYGFPSEWEEGDFEKVSPKQAAKLNRIKKELDKFDKGGYEYGEWEHYPFHKGWHNKGDVRKKH